MLRLFAERFVDLQPLLPPLEGEAVEGLPVIVEVDPLAARQPVAAPPFVVEGAIPCGQVTLLGAHGGCGKSFLALVLACHVALGRDLAHLRVPRPRPAVFASFEDGREVLLHRLRAICDAYGFDPALLAQRLRILDCVEAGALAEEVRRDGVTTLEPAAAVAALRQRIPDGALVVVDNASDTFAADENARRHVRAFMQLLRRELVKGDGAVLLLAHTPKDARKTGRESYSGSTAWHNSARARLSLTRDGDVLTLGVEKLNFGRLPPPLVLRVNDHGVPLPDAPRLPTAPVPADVNVLDAIRQAAARGQPIRAARVGAHPAGKVLHALLDGLHKRAEVEAALDRLLASGKVVTRVITTPSRNRREVLLPAASNSSNSSNPAFDATPSFDAPIDASNASNGAIGGTGDSTHALDASPLPAAPAESARQTGSDWLEIEL
ncbi:AAA domain protein [Tepidimonas alkaliphilus]|uniref:AAA domain protein n=1 Tax=Tepidimonas alkaliphilus TaxID=2588942 RepID=A0A554W4I3_9BURK|nr:AAA domain protein [Tepidimonas alkaliphilus]